MLLKEVGSLRDEKRNLLHEIGCLLCTKAKYEPGGEFDDPNWDPRKRKDDCQHVRTGAEKAPEPTPEVVEVDPHILPAEETSTVKPAWRNVQKQRRNKRPQAQETVVEVEEEVGPVITVAPTPHPESWASWKPTTLQPSPVGEPLPTLAVERQSGQFFGPRTPRSPRTSYTP